MPSFTRTVATAALGAAMLAGNPATLSPLADAAEARGGYGGGRHYRHHDRVSTGDVVLGVALIAGVAAVASAASKSERQREADRSRDYDRDYDRDYGNDLYRPAATEQGEAVDACARVAEAEARRFGSFARVRSVETIDRDGGRIRVRGNVEVERGRYGDSGRFACTAEDGRVTAFRFTEGFQASYRP